MSGGGRFGVQRATCAYDLCRCWACCAVRVLWQQACTSQNATSSSPAEIQPHLACLHTSIRVAVSVARSENDAQQQCAYVCGGGRRRRSAWHQRCTKRNGVRGRLHAYNSHRRLLLGCFQAILSQCMLLFAILCCQRSRHRCMWLFACHDLG